MLRHLSVALLGVALSASLAHAQASGTPGEILTTIPAEAGTVTHWYKQSVYDPSDAKIGEIADVLVDKGGKVQALIIGVGGFLGVGEKDVAVPFNAVAFKSKDNNKWYPVMTTTKDALKNAPGFKYDRSSMTWMAENTPPAR
jgi:sporulation protein YlmC with PRC-barrel domain